MAHSESLGHIRRAPDNVRSRIVVIQRSHLLRAISRFYRARVRGRLIYGLVTLSFIIAPFVMMFVAAPVAAALAPINRPDSVPGVRPEAGATEQLRRMPWSTSGLRRRP